MANETIDSQRLNMMFESRSQLVNFLALIVLGSTLVMVNLWTSDVIETNVFLISIILNYVSILCLLFAKFSYMAYFRMPDKVIDRDSSIAAIISILFFLVSLFCVLYSLFDWKFPINIALVITVMIFCYIIKIERKQYKLIYPK